jgi:hypothetical protein
MAAAPTVDDQWRAVQAYVGRAYVPGVYDCAHLAVDVQREVFGRSVQLPGQHRLGRAGQVAQIRACRDTLAQRIDAPEQGCAVLLTGTTDAGHPVWHIGTVVFFKGEPWALHNSAHQGSAWLVRLGGFAAQGLKIEGYYRWT